MDLPMYHPDQPESSLPPLPLPIPDEAADQPDPKWALPATAPGGLSDIVLGCSPFGYGIYAEHNSLIDGSGPVRIVRLALRAGIRAFDTSPWYHPSEIILGRALDLIKDEFPRESYSLITKVGKYGPTAKDHIYDPEVIRRSVERSLRRLKTTYLDVVYLHDVEYIAAGPSIPAGNPLSYLASGPPASTASSAAVKSNSSYLAPPYVPLGAGDHTFLNALGVLREYQQRGIIRRIGFSGYPLPVLLRLALLALHTTGIPVDIIQSYSHSTLLNSTLAEGYLARLRGEARVGEVVTASPLSMSILVSGRGPEWHPVNRPEGLVVRSALDEAKELCTARGEKIEIVALRYGLRRLEEQGKVVPVAAGAQTVQQLREMLACYRDARDGRGKETEDMVREVFKRRGVEGWSWASP